MLFRSSLLPIIVLAWYSSFNKFDYIIVGLAIISFAILVIAYKDIFEKIKSEIREIRFKGIKK